MSRSFKWTGLVLALFLVLFTAATAFAKEQTVTVTMKVTVPIYGKTALGSIVLHNTGSPDHIVVNWSFTGQVGGKQASASGKGEASWNGTSYEGSLTKIQTWSVPGIPKPHLPLRMNLKHGEGETFIVGILSQKLGWVYTTLAYTGIDGLPAPFGDDLALSVTNATGSDITDIPRTGEAPLYYYLVPLALVVVGSGLLISVRRSRRSEARL